MSNKNTKIVLNQYYVKNNNAEVYALDNNNNQIYVKDSNNDEILAKNSVGLPYYAVKKDNSQYYPKKDNKKEYLLKIGNEEIYAVNAKRAQIYPRDRHNREYPAKKNNVPYYATDRFLNQKYPRDKNGNEYKINDTFARTSKKNIIIPKNFKGEVMYDTDGKGKEIYMFENNSPVFGLDFMNNEIYCKDELSNEYYPLVSEMPVFAKDFKGRLKYALSAIKAIIYPKNKNNEEFYLTDSTGSYNLLLMYSDYFENYAIANDKQLYPIQFINGKEMEMIMKNKYAIDFKTSHKYYPADVNKNEYTDKEGNFIIYLEYPITTDGYIIVPNVDNFPKFFDDNVNEQNIVKLLYRPGWNGYDFLTDIKSKRSSFNPALKYDTLNLQGNFSMESYENILYYVIGVLLFIIFILSVVLLI